jgi:Peptidase family M1 domain
MQSNRRLVLKAPAFITILATILFICGVTGAFGQAPGANTDPTYVALRNITLGGEAVLLENVVLKREFGTFTFRSGNMFFVAPVNGKVTGAVFVGEGTLSLKPKSATEQRSLSLLSKTPDFAEKFETVVLRFTDDTYEELKKQGTAGRDMSQSSRAANALHDNLETLRSNRTTRYNLSARILQDVLGNSGGLFAAFIHGSNYCGKETFIVDPQGVRMYGMEPEEVVFMTYDENKYGVWAVSHLERELANGTASGSEMNAPIDVKSQKLDVEMEKSGELRGTATTTFVATREGVRVAPFSLFRNFKVQSVTDEAGQPLEYVLEQRSFNQYEGDDADNFNVIVPKALAAGEKFTFKTVYGGKEAVRNEGGGNYYPMARDDWFPYTRLGDYADYEMTFRIPKGMRMAATGTLASEKTEGNWDISEWKTEVPIGVAGFNFGRFKSVEAKLPNGVVIESYANDEQPDWVKGLQRAVEGDLPGSPQMAGVALGTMDTTGMMKRPLEEAKLAVQLYSDYFGEFGYKRLSMTQQTAPNYGQAWPGLIWLPICAFYDSTVRHQLGIDDVRQPYWDVVAPHEIAHEWWGHTVGWASYRDQWMSEGFAQLSASIFAQKYYKPGLFQRIWKSQQDSLLERNQLGFRPVDAGPLTMGFRVNSSRSGSNYTSLIYGKGSFVLHMLRMMMWDKRTGDDTFKATMRDFVKTYYNRPASTEDFKAVVEKHMTPQMDIDNNHKMDWFFNEWVYGTEVPKYEFTSSVGQDVNGAVLNFKLVQSNVSPQFKMLVPIYMERQDGSISRLGSATIIGDTVLEQKVPIGKSQAPKRLMINYYYDVLSATK